MFFLDLLLPGLGQYRRGQRLVGLTFGACAALVVIYMYWSNQRFLFLHQDLRKVVPRIEARELWAEKEAHKDRGLQVGLCLLLLSAADNWLASRQNGKSKKGRQEAALPQSTSESEPNS